MSGPPDLDRLARVPDPFEGDDELPAPPALPVPAPTRADHHRRLLVAGAAIVLLQPVWIVLSRHAMPLRDITMRNLVIGLGVPLLATAVTWLLATHRGRRGLGAPTSWLALGIALATLLFVTTTLATAPADQDASAAAFAERAMRCAVQAGVLGVVSLGVFAMAFRNAFATASTWRTAAIGVACGALATSTMSLACFHQGAMHVLLGHGWMIVAGGIAGAVVGRRFTRA
jgi:hypothetical protein